MSRVQFNLLPDVKLDYIKADRTKKFVTGVAVLASSIALAIFLILLFTVDVVQKKQISDATAQINTASSKLQNVQDLGQVLTVQNQLKTLATLHQNKHVSSRIFGYLPQITPTNINISKIDIDFTGNTLSISGTADSQATINTFIDTLKFTKYKVSDTDAEQNAFPSVIESNFSVTERSANYGLDIQFDPKLFSNSLIDASGHPQTPKLSVPKLTTTRSALDVSNSLFTGQPTNTSPASTGSR